LPLQGLLLISSYFSIEKHQQLLHNKPFNVTKILILIIKITNHSMYRTNIPDEQKGHAYHNLRLKFTSSYYEDKSLC
jgi:hypothetical protein